MMDVLRYFITGIIALAGFQQLFAQAETQNPNSAAGLYWRVKGNAGTSTSTNFIGTTDNVGLWFRTNNQVRMIIDSIGRVGIGAVPRFKFNVVGSGADTVLADFTHSPIFAELMNQSSIRVKSGPALFTTTLNSANALEILSGYGTNTLISRGINLVNASSSEVNYGIRNLANGGGISVTDSVIGIHSIASGAVGNIAMRGGAITSGTANTQNIGLQGFASGATDNWAGYFGNNVVGDGLVFIKDALSIGAANPVAELYVGGINANVVVDAVGTGGASVTAPTATTDRLLFANDLGYVKAIPSGSTGQVLTATASGPAWSSASATDTTDWNLLGNSGTIDGTNFIGTTDNVPFSIRVNNQKAGRIDQIKENVLLGNLAGANIPASMSNSLIIGDSAGFGILLDYPETLIIGSGAVSNGNGGGALTVVGSDAGKQNSGFSNSFFGYRAGRYNTTAGSNSFFGASAGALNTIGSSNSFFGSGAGSNNTTGRDNSFFGASAGSANTSGFYNTFLGNWAGRSNTTGIANIFIGVRTGDVNTVGSNNNFIGYYSGFNNVSGYANYYLGSLSGYSNVSGYSNIAIGSYALYSNLTSNNIAIGDSALRLNTSGVQNTALGSKALASNTTSFGNTAVGFESLTLNTGNANTAVGQRALYSNITGATNTAIGKGALQANLTSGNTAVGSESMFINTTGYQNTSLGTSTLRVNISGFGQTAIGYNALFNTTGSSNTALGWQAGYDITTGTFNTMLGYNTDMGSTTLTNATAIGANTRVDANNSVVIGSINGVSGATVTANVGIGITTPLDRLHVVGSIRMVDGNQGANKVMVSDANGTGSWQNLSAANVNAWSLTGNAGTSSTTNFLGTTDNVALAFRTNNQRSGLIDPLNSNSLFGYWAGRDMSTGTQNVAVGTNALLTNTTGKQNTTLGVSAMEDNTNGELNVAVGYSALQSNTTADWNTALGAQSLMTNTTGFSNTAVGGSALEGNTTGSSNEAIGSSALYHNTTGSGNTAVGTTALFTNFAGGNNTALGYQAMYNMDGGIGNVVLGSDAMSQGLSAFHSNVAVGRFAGYNNSSNGNTFLGYRSGYNNVNGYRNTILGDSADVLVSNLMAATAIGYNAKVSANNHLILGDTILRQQVGIGVTAVGKTLSGTRFEIASEGTVDNVLYRYQGPNDPTFHFQRSTGNLASPSFVAPGGTLGRLDYWGYEGTNWDLGARIAVEVDSNISTGIVPSRIVFYTQNGTGVLDDRLYIDRSGDIGINYNLPSVKLHVDGGVAIVPRGSSFTATTDNFPVTIDNESYIRITQTGGTLGTDRTIVLSNGLAIGQLLYIECTAGSIEFLEGTSNVQCGAAVTMGANDIAHFIWNGTDWLMVSVRAN